MSVKARGISLFIDIISITLDPIDETQLLYDSLTIHIISSHFKKAHSLTPGAASWRGGRTSGRCDRPGPICQKKKKKVQVGHVTLPGECGSSAETQGQTFVSAKEKRVQGSCVLVFLCS